MFAKDQLTASQALEDFLPRAGRDYTSTRNFDFGTARRENVSMLSPLVRLRMLPEWEICHRVLKTYSYSQASKFIDEVCWRTYWKGWLELRPAIWQNYLSAWDSLKTSYQSDPNYLKLISGESGIQCMDSWTRELIETGYLHNHTRMWYASIWIHTLKLPWVLGADLFWQHLLDGDAASNTLSWRWVAGLQTKGKSYLAKADNIRKFTAGRVDPDIELANEPIDLPEQAHIPEPKSLSALPPIPQKGRIGLLLHDEDLSAIDWLGKQIDCQAVAGILPEKAYASHEVSEKVTHFRRESLSLTLGRQGTYCPSTQAVLNWAKAADLDEIVMAQPSVGMWDDLLPKLKNTLEDQGIGLSTARHWWDDTLFPQAKSGFFRFKKSIPSALDQLNQLNFKL